MRRRVFLACAILASAVLLAATLSGCGVRPSVAEPTYGIDTVVVPTLAPATTMATARATAALSKTPPPTAKVTTPAAEAGIYIPDLKDLAAESYEGWQAYENATYGFGLRYPQGCTLTEVTEPGDTMAGHRIDLVLDADPRNQMMMAFRFADEDVQILPTSMSQGDIVDRGSIVLLGEELSREALVDRGADSRILYGGTGEVVRGDLVFWLTVDRIVLPDSGRAIPGDVQRTADAIYSSVWVKQE